MCNLQCVYGYFSFVLIWLVPLLCVCLFPSLSVCVSCSSLIHGATNSLLQMFSPASWTLLQLKKRNHKDNLSFLRFFSPLFPRWRFCRRKGQAAAFNVEPLAFWVPYSLISEPIIVIGVLGAGSGQSAELETSLLNSTFWVCSLNNSTQTRFPVIIIITPERRRFPAAEIFSRFLRRLKLLTDEPHFAPLKRPLRHNVFNKDVCSAASSSVIRSSWIFISCEVQSGHSAVSFPH